MVVFIIYPKLFVNSRTGATFAKSVLKCAKNVVMNIKRSITFYLQAVDSKKLVVDECYNCVGLLLLSPNDRQQK